jgi:hypothetical protein
MPDVTRTWRRSSFCADGNCVEVTRIGRHVVLRDGKDPDQPHLTFTTGAWQDFLKFVLTDDLRSSSDG